MPLYYTGTEAQIIAANNQINSNCGFPSGGTTTWAIPQQAYEQDFWFILMPPPEGYKNGAINKTQAEMIAGVVNVTEAESQPDWFPPNPPMEA